MVWGCLLCLGTGDLVVLARNEIMNQFIYMELLCDHLPGYFEKNCAEVFMFDGAAGYTAKSVIH